jgi:hypothetical protein
MMPTPQVSDGDAYDDCPDGDRHDGRHRQRRARLAVGAGLLGSAAFTVAMLATTGGVSAPTVVAVPGAAVTGAAGVSSAGISPAAEPPAVP